jgi:hypothetical protein
VRGVGNDPSRFKLFHVSKRVCRVLCRTVAVSIWDV